MFLCTLMIVALSLMQLQPDMIGTSARNVEEDARKSQRIPDSWEVVQSRNDELYALLFYKSQRIPDSWEVVQSRNDELYALLFYNPHNKNEYTYSLYVNKKGLSFGYIFHGGGGLRGISNPVIKYIFSLNEKRIQKIERDNGERDLMEIDVDKPIVAVFPLNSGIIKLYDARGKEILYETVVEEW